MVRTENYNVDPDTGIGTFKKVKIASKAKNTGSGNKKQGGPASKDKPTDFYGPGGMLPTSKIKA